MDYLIDQNRGFKLIAKLDSNYSVFRKQICSSFCISYLRRILISSLYHFFIELVTLGLRNLFVCQFGARQPI